jgi:hypothetical protein
VPLNPFTEAGSDDNLEGLLTVSVQSYQQACELIRKAGGGDFEGQKPEWLVAKAEATLGLTFPPSYRIFLRQMGCGDINGLEVFGLIDENFDNSSMPDGVWLTMNKRRHVGFDRSYVLIGEGGDGTYYALDTSHSDNSEEAPVVRLSVDGKTRNTVADSFGDYLLRAVKRVV